MPPPPGTDAPRRLIDALRYVGPGLILTAGIVGTGELVLTPRMAAEHGFSLLRRLTDRRTEYCGAREHYEYEIRLVTN